MKDLASEFKAVCQAYINIGEDLAAVDDTKDSGAYIQNILQKRNSLARIGQMTSTILQLSDEWKKCRSNLDPKSRTEIDTLARAARQRAARLNEWFSLHCRKVQAARDTLGKDLAELGKGARYLKSVKPSQNNYPKFIDSHC